jgi:Fe-S cluster biogenesis protein NfuA
MSVATTLVQQFDRMVRSDGGRIELVEADGSVVRVRYRPGAVQDCASGACALPGEELRQLMSEALARRDPGMRLELELAAPEEVVR